LVDPFKSEATDPILTLVLVGLNSLVVSELFVSIYIEAADTVTVCFIIDK